MCKCALDLNTKLIFTGTVLAFVGAGFQEVCYNMQRCPGSEHQLILTGTVLMYEGAGFQGVHYNVQICPGSEHQPYFDWHCANV